MNPRLGSIIQDQTGDVGIVLAAKEDDISALWERSGKVLSVFPDSIDEVLGDLDPREIVLKGRPGSGFLGLSKRAYAEIKAMAYGFPEPQQVLTHSIVLGLAEWGVSPPKHAPHDPFWNDFDARVSSESNPTIRLNFAIKRLSALLAGLVPLASKSGRLARLEELARELARVKFPRHQHRSYAKAKQDFVAKATDFTHLSEEQRMAVASTTAPTLVTARAGTGKTTTLVARACSLIQDLEIAPEEILILAFNKKAAQEIADRLERNFPGKPIPTALTFHALAYQVVKPKDGPLMDEEGNRKVGARSKFIEDLIRANWSPHVEACVHRILSESGLESWLENGLFHAPDEAYLRYRLKLPHFTLRGERVKSAGEKLIADFYTRHGLDYHYEKALKWDGRWYHPDFTLLHEGRLVLHEHWGVSSKPGHESVAFNWTKSYAAYTADMDRKRKFCAEQGIPLLETSIDDLVSGPEAFQDQLSKKLSEFGIRHHPLSDKEVMRLIMPLQKNRIRGIFESFIDRMKSSNHSLESIWERIRACHPTPATKDFLNICSQIYSRYQDRLAKEGRYDFSDLLDQAHAALSCGEASRTVIKTQNYRVDLADLQFVMIDEFQDFNLQFSNLIEVIKTLNPSLNVFCVGDDWQAINAFMGADTSHFFGFRDSDPMTMNLSLSLTRRCPRSHVDRSNALMKSIGGISVQSVKEDGPKPVLVEPSPENTTILVRKVVEIIQEYGRDKSYAVLFRTNTFDGRDIEELYRKVSREYENETKESWNLNDHRIHLVVSTVHRFKGKEADVVVVADASAFSYPMLHPDSVFFEAFGDTPEKLIQDERRLFYVALTRSKEHLRILYDDKIGASPFLEEAGFPAGRRGGESAARSFNRARTEVPF